MSERKPWYQKTVERIPTLAMGVMILGGVLDSFSNVVSLFTVETAKWFTIAILVAWGGSCFAVKRMKLKWWSDGSLLPLKKLNWAFHAPFFVTIGFVWLCLALLAFRSAPRIAFVSVGGVEQEVNDIADMSDINNVKTISETELGTFEIRIKNTSQLDVKLSHGMLIVEEYEDPLGDGTLRSTAAVYFLMDHRGHVIAPIGKLGVGNACIFGIDKTLPARTPFEFSLWIRLLDEDRPPVTKLEVTLRLFDDEGRFVDSKPFKARIHRETEELLTAEEMRQKGL